MSYAAYFVLEKKLKSKGYPVDRHDLIYQYTKGEKSSLRQLNSKEYQAFLNWLNTAYKQTWEPVDPVANTMRRKIIAILKHQMGYTMQDIDAWCKVRGTGKKLNDNSTKELAKLVTGAERMYAGYQKKLAQ